jgi:hypothetical protein
MKTERYYSSTNSMELCPCWEAASCAATQEFTNNWWNPTVHYLVHKSHPLIPILSQTDLIHITPFCLSKICFSIILLPISRYSLCSPFWISYQRLAFIPLFPISATNTPDSPWSAHSDYIWQSYSTLMNLCCNRKVPYSNLGLIATSVAWIREWTVPTERPPLVGEVSANFCG